jgi:hypothetical protein
MNIGHYISIGFWTLTFLFLFLIVVLSLNRNIEVFGYILSSTQKSVVIALCIMFGFMSFYFGAIYWVLASV